MITQKTITMPQILGKALDASMEGKFYDSQIGAQVASVVCQSLVNRVWGLTNDQIFSDAKLVEDLGVRPEDGFAIAFDIQKTLNIDLSKYKDLLKTKEHTPQTVLGLAKLIYTEKMQK